MSPIQAIAAGRAPRPSRGYLAHRMLARLTALPRAATLGLAAPFARPARTLVTVAAIVSGAAAVTFGVGLAISLNRVVRGQSGYRTAGARFRSSQAAARDRAASMTAAQQRGRGLGAGRPAGHTALRCRNRATR